MRIQHPPATTAFPRARCVHCGRAILLERGAGWVEPFPGNSFDTCPAVDGAHEPDPRSRSERPYWMPDLPDSAASS